MCHAPAGTHCSLLSRLRVIAMAARNSGLLLLFVVASIVVGRGLADIEAERAECAGQLVGLATCLPYVQGRGRAPTPDCCSGFKQVVDRSFKCLCLLVKDRNDPALGIKFNVTLTLLLPSKCNAPADAADCPKTLGIPENSAEAKMFQQFAADIRAATATGSQDQHSASNASGEKKKEKESSMSTNGGDQGRGHMSTLILSLLSIFFLLSTN